MTPETRLGRVSFIGAGPGAADLITVRGARHIAEADIVVWAASLVTPECVQEHARADAELVDSSRLTHEDAVEIYRRAERDRLNVARVHSGDPALWGAVQEQHDVCARMELEVEIVPGVAAFSAAAAAVGRELTVPEVAQSVVLTRLEGGKTPMPSGERVREFAKHGTTMALFLSAARTGQLVEELRAGGYGEDVPVVIAYKTTWPDELLLRTTLGELETTVKQHKLWRHTLFLVGWALTEGGTRSHLYNPGHFHTFRRADPAARRALRAQRGDSQRGESQRGESQRGDSQRTRRSSSSGADRPRSEGRGGTSPVTEGAASWGRTSRTAESRNVGSAITGTTSGGADPVPEPRVDNARSPGQPDPDVAWWAVREWQQSAQGTARIAATRTTARQSGHDSAQSDLFEHAEEETSGMPGDAQAVTTDAVTTDAVTTDAAENGAAENGAAENGEAVESGAATTAGASGTLVSEQPEDEQTARTPATDESVAEVPDTDSLGNGSTVETQAGMQDTAQDEVKSESKSRTKAKSTGKSGSAAKSSTKAGSNSGHRKKGTEKQASGKAGRARTESEQD
ncbi:precorrin-4 C11-methyltransferase [Haloactinomyces albus]|uniref:Precorrin-4 C11-methyltransferase n=1 Tax=Haloactinomyces albus TaxID=1352928 RepID=A0AAE4CM69_9ACTN|nr:precorrin-4 C(11)-methyltransferase [Haloactinomyces albus]MDR7300672.1 precorrin-4 C11-methyltransferase [Haloactinomyces albus]